MKKLLLLILLALFMPFMAGAQSVFKPVQGGTGINSYSVGDLIWASGATMLSKLNIGNTGECLKVAAGGTSYEFGTCGSGGSGFWPFITTDSNYAVPVQSTTTPLWLKNGVFASSTSRFVYASTTAISAQTVSAGTVAITNTGNAYIPNLFLAGGASANYGFSPYNATGFDWANGSAISMSYYAGAGGGMVLSNASGYKFSSGVDGAPGTEDTGFSRLGAASVALGNGTAANTSGTLTLATLKASATVQSPTVDFTGGSNYATISLHGGGNGILVKAGDAYVSKFTDTDVRSPSNYVYAWTDGTSYSGAVDTGLSRLGANSVAIGNGTTGDTSGTLTVGALTASTDAVDNSVTLANGSGSSGMRFRVAKGGRVGSDGSFSGAIYLQRFDGAFGVGYDLGSDGWNPAADDATSLGNTSYRWKTLAIGTGGITSAGKVGIGTTTPSQTLSVQGNGLFSGNITSVASITATGTLKLSAITGTQCLHSINGVVSGTGSDCGAGGGGSGGGTWSTTTSTVSGQLVNYPNNDADIVTIGSNSTTTSEYWFDPNIQRSYLSGNVGIGTSNPLNTLDVEGSGAGSVPVRVGGGAGVGYFELGAGDATKTGYLSWRLANNNRLGYMGFDASNIALNLESSANFVVNGGNVGVGTTTPSKTLSVQGDTLISGNLSVAGLTATGTVTLIGKSNGCASFTSGVLDSTGVACGSGSGGSGNISTSTAETAGQLAYWTSTAATPALLGKVATTSLTATSPLSLSQPISVIGASASALSISTAGDWTGTIDGNNFAGGAIGAGDLLYGASAGSITELSMGASSTVLTNDGSVPKWNKLSPGNFTTTNISQWTNDSGYITSLSGAASSTLLADNNTFTGKNTFTRASTTQLTLLGQLYDFNNSAGTGGHILMSRGAGLAPSWVASTTFSGGVTYSAGNVTCDTASASVFGCLTAASFSKFNSATTTFSTGLTYAAGAVTVNTSQNIATLSNLTGNGAILTSGGAGTLGTYAGTSCTNQFVRSLSGSIVATCATVANTDLANSTISGIALGSNLAALTATDSTLTFSGSYTGATARTVGLNLGNLNTWTVLQTFSSGLNVTAESVGIGTSTPKGGQLVIATSTASQLILSDTSTSNATMNIRMKGNSLYFATSSPVTPYSTSTLPALELKTEAGVLPGIEIGTTTSATTTIKMGKIQFDGYNDTGTRVCVYFVGTTPTVSLGACN